jgi:hypothetical protein
MTTIGSGWGCLFVLQLAKQNNKTIGRRVRAFKAENYGVMDKP